MKLDLDNLPYDDLFDTYLADETPHPDSPHHFSEIHKRGLWHKCAGFFGIYPGRDPTVYFQKRSSTVAFPNLFTITAGGHVDLGNTPLDTRHEIEEEIGLVVAPDELLKIGEYQHELITPDIKNREFKYHFAFEMPHNLSPISPNPVEVTGVYGAPLSDVRSLLADDTAIEMTGIKYKKNEWVSDTVNVRFNDFYPLKEESLSDLIHVAQTKFT